VVASGVFLGGQGFSLGLFRRVGKNTETAWREMRGIAENTGAVV